MQKPIFLIGFMGSGKTTFGKKIAKAMDIPFVDLDQEIVTHIGSSIAEYFERYGEEAFRQVEQQILHQQADKYAIISTGGGTPCFFDNMQWINHHGLSIYLEHSARSLWARLNQSDINKRPVLAGMTGDELLTFIEDKLQERAPFYQQASICVDQINTDVPTLTALIHKACSTE